MARITNDYDDHHRARGGRGHRPNRRRAIVTGGASGIGDRDRARPRPRRSAGDTGRARHRRRRARCRRHRPHQRARRRRRRSASTSRTWRRSTHSPPRGTGRWTSWSTTRASWTRPGARRSRAGRRSSAPTTSATSRSPSGCTPLSRPRATRGSSRSPPAATRSSPVVFDDLFFERREYTPGSAYGQSKTANVLFAVEATRRWARRRDHRQRADAGRHLDAAAAPLERRAARRRPGAGPAGRGGRRVPHEDDRAGRRHLGVPRDVAAGRGHRRPLLRGLPRGRGRRRAARRHLRRTAPCPRRRGGTAAVGRIRGALVAGARAAA